MTSTKKNIVLFDMDGTLTCARKKAEWSLVRPLRMLSKYADIGVVTGSPLNYLMQQCGLLWDALGSVDVVCFQLFPCNGTQAYTYDFEKSRWESFSNTDMRSHIGTDNYNKLVREILSLQSAYVDQYPEMPLTGNFISDRKSMINWCPVGRDADDEHRLLFGVFDKKQECRTHLKESLELVLSYMGVQNIECVLGGNTSIDIYPSGWDKTYVLRHLEKYENIFFVGDKCEGMGNDMSLYEALTPGETSFKTTGPHDTVIIIHQLIKHLETQDNVTA